MTVFPQASVSESLRFTALVALPNLAGGLFRRRPAMTLTLDRLGMPRRAHRLMAALERRYGEGPLWVSVAGTKTLLVFGVDPVRFVLSQAPEPFASDPEPKRSGMQKFQPHALTISRGEQWSDRRRFTDAVLARTATDPAIRDRVSAVAVEEASAIPYDCDWPQFNAAVQRMTRRIILGEAAAADTEISTQLATLMTKANPPGKGDTELFGAFFSALDSYVRAREKGSLVGLFGDAPVTDVTRPTHQVIHWMFAMGDTLAINLWSCLALLATHPDVLTTARLEMDAQDRHSYLAGCLCEAMRLWPSTPVLARTVTRDTDWNGAVVHQGTPVMIVNAFNHRDDDRVPHAHSFEPTEWTDGSAGASWAFNFFSHGPQACPGADLAVRLGTTMLSALVNERDALATGITLDPRKWLPLTLNHSRMHIRFTSRRGA